MSTIDPAATAAVREVATRAREASYELALATRTTKDAALSAMAQALLDSSAAILAANTEDVTRAEGNGTPSNIIDRLTTTPQVDQPLILALSSPFIDSSDWKAEVAVNLAPERRANLELVIRSDAHGVLARVPLAKDSRFTLTLSQGAFNTRENLAVQLQDKTTGKTISAVNRTVFTP